MGFMINTIEKPEKCLQNKENGRSTYQLNVRGWVNFKPHRYTNRHQLVYTHFHWVQWRSVLEILRHTRSGKEEGETVLVHVESSIVNRQLGSGTQWCYSSRGTTECHLHVTLVLYLEIIKSGDFKPSTSNDEVLDRIGLIRLIELLRSRTHSIDII